MLKNNVISNKPRLGVAVLVEDDRGRILLGQRGKQPNYGKWVIPGGGVKLGESIASTAHREINEETGLEIHLTDDPPFVREIINQNEHRVILFMQAEVTGGHLQPASDLLDAKFFSREDISGIDISPVVISVLLDYGWAVENGNN